MKKKKISNDDLNSLTCAWQFLVNFTKLVGQSGDGKTLLLYPYPMIYSIWFNLDTFSVTTTSFMNCSLMYYLILARKLADWYVLLTWFTEVSFGYLVVCYCLNLSFWRTMPFVITNSKGQIDTFYPPPPLHWNPKNNMTLNTIPPIKDWSISTRICKTENFSKTKIVRNT